MYKWILNVVFGALPLVVWVASIAQELPTDAVLSGVNIVSIGTTTAQVITAAAFVVLAHQIGVTSARVLLFVSRNVAEVLFSGTASGNVREQHTGRAVKTM